MKSHGADRRALGHRQKVPVRALNGGLGLRHSTRQTHAATVDWVQSGTIRRPFTEAG